MIASAKGYKGIVEHLLSVGANVNLQNNVFSFFLFCQGKGLMCQFFFE